MRFKTDEGAGLDKVTAWIHGLAKQAAEVFIAFLPSLVEASATLLLGWVLAY
jgi:hypothetical protein